jgi:hypothetical protein
MVRNRKVRVSGEGAATRNGRLPTGGTLQLPIRQDRPSLDADLVRASGRNRALRCGVGSGSQAVRLPTKKAASMTRIVEDDRARQGPKGKPVLGVLIGALVLCAVALAGYMVWSGAESPDAPGQNASREAITGSPSGSGTNPSGHVNPANPAYPAPSSTGSTTR